MRTFVTMFVQLLDASHKLTILDDNNVSTNPDFTLELSHKAPAELETNSKYFVNNGRELPSNAICSYVLYK